jgi:putative tricarboxylic transport membrane protein
MMDSLTLLFHGFEIALTPTGLLFTFIGVLLGQLIGALPGIGPAAGMALLLPVTFGMQPTFAVMMLAGIMYGGQYGGTLTSVLINVPGEASSVMTAVDGHQLAKQGHAGKALSVAAVGSFLAGVGAVIVLVFAAPALSRFALSFSSPEYFLLATLGLTASAGFGSSSILKALLVTSFGLVIALIGTDPMAGTPRMTLGSQDLLDGLDFLPVAIGLFGIGEVLASFNTPADAKIEKMRMRDLWPTWADWVNCRMAMLRGGIIGFFIGVMPGAGAAIASLMAYFTERKFSKHPEKFGHGALDAIAAAESANNAAAHGAFIPMLALGIPGGPGTAVMLGALILAGIRPGPALMTEQSALVWGLIASMFTGNIMLLILNLPLAPVFASVLRIPYVYIAPSILGRRICSDTQSVHGGDSHILRDIGLLHDPHGISPSPTCSRHGPYAHNGKFVTPVANVFRGFSPDFRTAADRADPALCRYPVSRCADLPDSYEPSAACNHFRRRGLTCQKLSMCTHISCLKKPCASCALRLQIKAHACWTSVRMERRWR